MSSANGKEALIRSVEAEVVAMLRRARRTTTLKARTVDPALATVGYQILAALRETPRVPQSVLVDALTRISEGETVVDPTIVSRLLGRRRSVDPLESLTSREREVLALVAEGLANRAIASRLFIGERTVETHVTRIFEKLGLPEDTDSHRRVLAVLAFLRTS